MASRKTAGHGVPTVGQYMTASPHWIGADDALSEARITMREHRIRHLPVMRSAELVGVVSERDISLVESLPNVRTETRPVEEAMTPTPYTVSPATPLHEVARVMAERKYGAAVVVDQGAVIGVFTTTDAMRALADALCGPPKERTKTRTPAARKSTPARKTSGGRRTGPLTG
jgi:acetoin utilization protein AcuB